jgi:CRP-like cAMP-binding protein
VLLLPGAIFGYVDYHLEQERSFTATVASQSATVCTFTRESIDAMAEQHPKLCILLERSVLKHSSMELSNHSV